MIEKKKNDYGERLWRMTEYFYTAWSIFHEIFEHYEEQVIKYSRMRGVNRQDLRLSADELSNLFDLQSIEKLRDEVLFELKSVTHVLFRGEDSTDELDRYCSDIYHEMSILKEEHYTVKTYASEYQDREAAGKILDEVHVSFPFKLNQIMLLFRKAKQRLEEILLSENRSKILVRSMYLFGDELLLPVYPEGLLGLYRIIYPGGGSCQGFLVASQSFFESNFYTKAAEALERAKKRLAVSDAAGDFNLKLKNELEQMTKKIEPFNNHKNSIR